jgi:hypothetical protein
LPVFFRLGWRILSNQTLSQISIDQLLLCFQYCDEMPKGGQINYWKSLRRVKRTKWLDDHNGMRIAGAASALLLVRC